MAFTFSQTATGNVAQTYDLEVSINPDSGIINHVFEVGDVAAGTISVENTGLVNAQLYLTADWGPSAGTTDRQATLLANALGVSIFVSSAGEAIAETAVFAGRFLDLIDVSVFSTLSPGNVVDVGVSVIMPSNRTGPTLLNKAIVSDFVFVAVSTA